MLKSLFFVGKAFIEAVQQRDKYEQIKVKLLEKQRHDTIEYQKLVSGKTTLKSLMSRKTKDEDILTVEKQIAQVSTFALIAYYPSNKSRRREILIILRYSLI